MVFNIVSELSGLFRFFKMYGASIEELQQILAGYSTSTPGIFNVVYNIPKRKIDKPLKRIKAFEEKDFEFNFTESLIIKTRRVYQYNDELEINLPYGKKIYQSINVLTPFTVNEIYSLQVIIKNLSSKISEKFGILTKILGKSIKYLSINTLLKNSFLNSFKVFTFIKSRGKNRLDIIHKLKESKYNDRLENQSVYMGDVGQIEELELVQILGDINALRH